MLDDSRSGLATLVRGLAQDEDRVLTAESKRMLGHDVERGLARLAMDDIETDGGIGIAIVARGRNDLFSNCVCGDNRFQRSGSAHAVTKRALDRRNRYFPGPLPKHDSDRFSLGEIAGGGGGSMSMNVTNTRGID